MNTLQPTLFIKPTLKNAKNFLQENQFYLFGVFKRYVPYMFLMYIIELIVLLIYKVDFLIGDVLSLYFYLAMIITWHRVVLLGGENTEEVNPFKPKSNDLTFIFMYLVILFISVIAALIVGATLMVIFETTNLAATNIPILKFLPITVSLTISLLILVYTTFRLSFFLPSKAINHPHSLISAFKLSKKYTLRIITSITLFTLPVFIIGSAYGLLTSLLVIPVLQTKWGDGTTLEITRLILQAPNLLFFTPIIGIMVATILSNYYLHALETQKKKSNS